MSQLFTNSVPPARDGDSLKWNRYPSDILPLWIADVDFPSPPAVIEALQQRIATGHFGYGRDSHELSEVICARMRRLYNWHIEEKDIVPLSGLVSGLNIACRAIGKPGDSVVIQTPVYPPFLTAPALQQRNLLINKLVNNRINKHIYYDIDFGDLNNKIAASRLFLLCHPHNPVGRSFSTSELQQMAAICQQNDVIICSDEIHSDLILDGEHQPIASINPEIAERTISLFAPSKSFNIPGLGYSYAIITNSLLRKQFIAAMDGIVPHPNILGVTAALAAYKYGEAWLQQLITTIRSNRDFALNFIHHNMVYAASTEPTATYLLWLDLSRYQLEDPYTFLLHSAKVATSSGIPFGAGGEQFVRLNLGCTQQLLAEALQRIATALLQR